MSNGTRRLHVIEALAALANLVVPAIYRSLARTLRRSTEQRRRNQAWLTAHALLDEMRRDSPLVLGRSDGRTTQGMSWEAAVELYSPPADASESVFAPIRTGPLRPLEIRIVVRWGNPPGRSIQLRCIEFAIHESRRDFMAPPQRSRDSRSSIRAWGLRVYTANR
jgi:hypothetical protein